MVLLQRKLYFRRGPTFSRRVQLFPGGGGVQMLISIETHITFFQGGGGSGPGRFFSPQLILQFTEGGRWFYYRENYTLEGVQHFPGGSNFFQGGGVQMLISIETHITYIYISFRI